MTEWLRLWHDMPTDPKWRAIARKSGKPLPCVIALFNLLMVNASANAAERGTLSNWSDEDAAAALDMDEADVAAIIAAMEGKVVTAGRLTGWERRQPKREDGTAAERKAAWKERKNALERTGTHGNAPETDTDTDTETEREKSEVNTSDLVERAPERLPEKPKTKSVQKGSRLSPEWQADEADAAFGRSLGFTDSQFGGEVAKFRDHWIAKAGQAGVKLDWQATLRNWLRKSAEYRGIAPVVVSTGPPAEPVRKFDNDEDFKKWWRERHLERQQSEAIQ